MSRKAQTVIQQKKSDEWKDIENVEGYTAEAIKRLRDDGTPGIYRIIIVKKHVTVTATKAVNLEVS